KMLTELKDRLMLWVYLQGPSEQFARHFTPRLVVDDREIEPALVQNERTAIRQENGRYLARCVYWFPTKDLTGTARPVLVVRVAACSVAGWWLFEWYNAPRFWRGGEDAVGLWWQYHNLEPNLFLRRVGYDWAFGTIFPALFLTAAALRATVFARCRVRPWTPPRALLTVCVVTGVVAVATPLIVVSRWLVPLVWLGWLLL